MWSFAAFGEEIAYRGYLLTRGAEAGGGSAAAYLLAGRNLWACVLAHGFIDTFAVVVTYFGVMD